MQTAGLEEMPFHDLEHSFPAKELGLTEDVTTKSHGLHVATTELQSAQLFPHPRRVATEPGRLPSQSPAHLDPLPQGPMTVLKGQGTAKANRRVQGFLQRPPACPEVLWTRHHSVLSHFGLHTSSDGQLTTYAGCLSITHLLNHYYDIKL